MATSRSSDDRDSFQLPQAGLFADVESGASSVALTDEFRNLLPDRQILIIQGWRDAMGEQLRDLHVQHYRYVTAAHANLALPDKIALYRAHCATLGIDIPPTFTLMLQQA